MCRKVELDQSLVSGDGAAEAKKLREQNSRFLRSQLGTVDE